MTEAEYTVVNLTGHDLRVDFLANDVVVIQHDQPPPNDDAVWYRGQWRNAGPPDGTGYVLLYIQEADTELPANRTDQPYPGYEYQVGDCSFPECGCVGRCYRGAYGDDGLWHRWPTPRQIQEWHRPCQKPDCDKPAEPHAADCWAHAGGFQEKQVTHIQCPFADCCWIGVDHSEPAAAASLSNHLWDSHRAMADRAQPDIAATESVA